MGLFIFIREAQLSNFYSEFIRENEQISSTPNLPFPPGLGWFKSFLSTLELRLRSRLQRILAPHTGRDILVQVLASSLTMGWWNTVSSAACDRDCKLAQAWYSKGEAIRLLNRRYRRFLCSSYTHSVLGCHLPGIADISVAFQKAAADPVHP